MQLLGGAVVSQTKALLAVVAGVLSAFFWTVPAQAHNSFTGSNPKNGARIAEAPETVTLSFLAKLDASSTKVTVTGPDGASAADGEPTVTANKATIGVRDAGGGAYTVAFHVSSVDGHPVKGKMTFTVTAPVVTPTTSAAPAPTIEPPATNVPDASTTAVGAVPVADSTDGGTPWVPWAIGAVVLIGAAAAGTWLIRRRAV
jgi:methionine-rich copper-binding protein CopC